MFLDLSEFLVVGDIEGRFSKLEELLSLCPKDLPVISLGDAHDRGHENLKVLDFFMKPNRYMVQSNHTELLLDFLDGSKKYDGVGWIQSGGKSFLIEVGVDAYDIEQMEIDFSTYKQYIYEEREEKKKLFRQSRQKVIDQFNQKIDQTYISYLRNLPMHIETKDVILTHAPINPVFGTKIPEFNSKRSEGFLWNRGKTRRIKDKFQIHGHMSLKQATFLKDKNGVYGINLDSSINNLSAFHWPSREVYEVSLCFL